jgi:hypothetical protein
MTSSFSHLVRAAMAIALALALPAVLYAHINPANDIEQVYLDALAAVVAFYFGASSKPS